MNTSIVALEKNDEKMNQSTVINIIKSEKDK